MDAVRNPYVPGAGTPPPSLTGREDVLEKARVTLARISQGRPSKSFILVGLRGVGKTVLLNKISAMAEDQHYRPIYIEAHEDKSLASLLAPRLKQVLFSLDRFENLSDKTKHALRVLKSFISSLKTSYGDIEFGIEIDPQRGTADTGDLELDIPELFLAVANAALARKTAVALIIDEIQYLTEKELSALIMAVHRVAQRQLPLVLIAAGLPQLVGLAGKSKSYAERLFDYPEVGALGAEDATAALVEPAQREGVHIEEDAVTEIIEITRGYPYFLQEWGYHAWNLTEKSPITINLVRRATVLAIKRLDESFFRVRFDRLTPREKKYLFAMAELGEGPHRSGDIAEKLGLRVQNVAPARNSLIKKGMIYSPSHGDTAFTVPLFDAYLKRVMSR